MKLVSIVIIVNRCKFIYMIFRFRRKLLWFCEMRCCNLHIICILFFCSHRDNVVELKNISYLIEIHLINCCTYNCDWTYVVSINRFTFNNYVTCYEMRMATIIARWAEKYYKNKMRIYLAGTNLIFVIFCFGKISITGCVTY